MYNKVVEKRLKKLEKEYIKELKEKENINKKVEEVKDLIYTNNYTLKDYIHNGDSGTLYLAINKHDKTDKYLVKHYYRECACNEYMYSKIGNKLGINIPEVKLFIINDKEKKFNTSYACGIKYLDDSKRVYYKDIIENKDNISNWKDYFKIRGLESLLEESDDIEILLYKNLLYRIDNQASFSISDYYLGYLGYNFTYNNIDIKKWTEKKILEQARPNKENRFSMWNINQNNFIKYRGKKYLDYYLEPFRLLSTITDSDIEEWINTITYIYPDIIGEYYKKYLTNLKLDVEEFLLTIK